jgi:hypothetical protein
MDIIILSVVMLHKIYRKRYQHLHHENIIIRFQYETSFHNVLILICYDLGIRINPECFILCHKASIYTTGGAKHGLVAKEANNNFYTSIKEKMLMERRKYVPYKEMKTIIKGYRYPDLWM